MKYLLLILFPFLLSAQDGVTRFYVDKDATGSNTGRSWADAWTSFDSLNTYWSASDDVGGVNWNIITAGDTIYVDCNGDSVVFVPNTGAGTNQPYGLTIGDGVNKTWVSGNPPIVCPSWESGKTGKIVITDNVGGASRLLWIKNLSNIKFVGFTVRQTSVSRGNEIGGTNYPATDSLITLEDCNFIGAGYNGIIGSNSINTTYRRCIFENVKNSLPNDQDPMGFNTGGGGTIDSCKIIMRNDYEIIDDAGLQDGAGMTVTETSLTDTDLNMVTDYHIGNSVWVNGYFLQITSNNSNTFYGTAWDFEEIVQNNGSLVIITSTSLQDNNTESWNEGTLVGAVITAQNGSKLIITSNSGTTFTGSAGWDGGQPPNGTTYVIGGGDAPVSGVAWVMGGAHRDGIQISNLASGSLKTFTVKNSLIIDTEELGTGWNNLFYNYSDLVTPHISFVFYNNIIVSRKIHTSPNIFAIGGNYNTPGYDYVRYNSIKILNNTFITKGQVGGFLTSWTIDTLIVKNNLIISDTIDGAFYNPENTESLWNAVIKDIDYNIYAKYGGIADGTTFASNISNTTWGTWKNYDNYDASGVDANSSTLNSTTISFYNKYGTTLSDYYTPTGVGLGTDLSSDYPFLSTDALGNARTGTWDIGALEYQGAPVDSTPSNVSFNGDDLNAELNTQYTGAIYDLIEFDSAYAHIDRGWYNIDGGAFKSSNDWTMVYPNDDIMVWDTSSTEYSTSKTITLTIGNASDTWTVRTKNAPIVSSGVKLFRTDNANLLKDKYIKYVKVGSDGYTPPPAIPDTVAPNPPTSFVAVGGTSSTQFQTNWTNPGATDLDSIRYYEGSANDTTQLHWILSLSATTGYLRTGRTSNTTYWSAVKAVDDSGNVSYFSNVDSAKTLSTETGTPLANLDLAYLTNSFAAHLYDHSLYGTGGATNMQDEMTAYNTANSSDGSLTRISPDYPDCGDMIWDWNQVFFGGTGEGNTSPNQNVIEAYAKTSTYDILQVTFGFNSGDIWFSGWYVDITDTANYAQSHIENVYKYWIRQMVTAMERHPDKYWILWNIPPVTVGSSGGSADALRHANFNKWMVDTLQAGLDSYGTFPANIYVFDVYSLLKEQSSNFMNPDYADGLEDSHPNQDAQDVVAPIYIQEVFDKARAYRIPE